jgi:hypothetical protein
MTVLLRRARTLTIRCTPYPSPQFRRRAIGIRSVKTTRREFEEETGFRAVGDFVDPGSIKQKSGKIVTAWAI